MRGRSMAAHVTLSHCGFNPWSAEVWLLLGRWLGVALALAGAPAAGQAEPREGARRNSENLNFQINRKLKSARKLKSWGPPLYFRGPQLKGGTPGLQLFVRF